MQHLVQPVVESCRSGRFSVSWTLADFSTKTSDAVRGHYFNADHHDAPLECRFLVNPNGYSNATVGKVTSKIQFRNEPVGMNCRGLVKVLKADGSLAGEKWNNWKSINNAFLYGPKVGVTRRNLTLNQADQVKFQADLEYSYQAVSVNEESFGTIDRASAILECVETYMALKQPNAIIRSNDGLDNPTYEYLLVGSSEILSDLWNESDGNVILEEEYDSVTVRAFLYFLKHRTLPLLNEQQLQAVRSMGEKYDVETLCLFITNVLENI